MQKIKTMHPRARLLMLLGGQVLLSIGYGAFKLGWLYYPSLIWGIITVVYAFSIRCHVCGRRQVVRGASVFDLRLPAEKCYFCKSDIETS